ncbi:mitochondrial import inner membrane translocase [Striga asiatica]|uniref:Mitochondrial import inner membrane translocase n=1 Tax=Striga asiatica TaxID=4170 RepID=A0A5A7R0F6_STRAF|nr:mitochondrial import inner membrane translocase [Striga asiatica]
MAKPSQARFIFTFFHHIVSEAPAARNGISQIIRRNPKSINTHTSSSWLLNSQRSHFSSSASTPGIRRNSDIQAKFSPAGNFLARRYVSFTNPEMGSGNFVKKMVKNPALFFKGGLGRYREALRLQIESFLRRNFLAVAGAGGLVVCVVLWRVLFGVADVIVGFSEGMAEFGFLALSSAVVVFSGLYLHARFNINPDKVYRMAMRRLNTSAGILEAMGAPLRGTDVRAYVMSGGGITLKNFSPRLRSKRCFLIFPIQGSERKGLVSVEVRKNKGQYDMKLLAVDVQVAGGPDQRLFLTGDEEEYKIGDGLISELRDPVVKAMSAAKELEAHDLKEDEEDEQRELQEAEIKKSTVK